MERNTAKVFLARGGVKRKQHLRNMKILTKSGVYSEELAEKALRISIREKDTREEDIVLALQWLTLNSARPDPMPLRDGGPEELNYRTLDTQTTPADFRSVEVRVPIRLDFTAIHNNESGHHGVDYSYRKLLARCGSQWANEKGLATKVKKDLKRFIDECPICQKIRGLHSRYLSNTHLLFPAPFWKPLMISSCLTNQTPTAKDISLSLSTTFLSLWKSKRPRVETRPQLPNS